LIIEYPSGDGWVGVAFNNLIFMHFIRSGVAGTREFTGQSTASNGDYQAILEDISVWPFLVARAGYAMLKWHALGLEQAAQAASGKN
jgi:hypothetical protein